VKPLPNLDEKMDAVIIAVAHKQFTEMPAEKIRSLMDDHPVLVDVRGMVDRDAAEKLGMFYRKL
jgi:UDP-N-acetyl-D-galactosamine dehydrogenase